jgi:hypothetical protein
MAGEELLELAGGHHHRQTDEGTRPDRPLTGSGGIAQAAKSTRRGTARSPHLSLAAVVPTLIEVQDSEDRRLHEGGGADDGSFAPGSRLGSPSLLARQKSIGEFVREAVRAALDLGRA